MKKICICAILLTPLICIRCRADFEPEPCIPPAFELIGEHDQWGDIYYEQYSGKSALLPKLVTPNDSLYLGDYEYFFKANIPENRLYEDTFYIFNPISITLNLLEGNYFVLRYQQQAYHRDGPITEGSAYGYDNEFEGAWFGFDGFSVDSVRSGTWAQISETQLQLISGSWNAKVKNKKGGDIVFTPTYVWLFNYVMVGRDPGKPFPTSTRQVKWSANTYLELSREIAPDTVFMVSLYSDIVSTCYDRGY
ncbi:MAG: hypothetical protein IH946_08205 [Bacteroidetes bacterium]|nr:hypothetical protein [Bacteroidota bacterium]